MVAGHLLARAATLVATGIAGAAVVDRLKAPSTGRAVRRGVVAVTAAAMAGKRKVETGAENLRLSAGDVAAEAREKIGEEARPPAADAGHHDHDH